MAGADGNDESEMFVMEMNEKAASDHTVAAALIEDWVKKSGADDQLLVGIKVAIEQEFDQRTEDDAEKLRNLRELRSGRALPGKKPSARAEKKK